MEDIVKGNVEMPESRRDVRVMLDIDGTITHAPDFFKMFSQLFINVAEVHIVTGRYHDDHAELTLKELDEYGIKYHKAIFTQNKLRYVIEEGINIVFEDVDEYFLNMPEGVVVFKIREEDNFDWSRMKWIYDDKTGIHIEDVM